MLMSADYSDMLSTRRLMSIITPLRHFRRHCLILLFSLFHFRRHLPSFHFRRFDTFIIAASADIFIFAIIWLMPCHIAMLIHTCCRFVAFDAADAFSPYCFLLIISAIAAAARSRLRFAGEVFAADAGTSGCRVRFFP